MKIALKIVGILLIAYFVLALILSKFVEISFAVWNSKKEWTEIQEKQIDSINSDELKLLGVYEYKTENDAENHFVFIDTVNAKLVGFYFGTEDSGGHGIFYYGNPLLNFKHTKNKIEFEIGERELYNTTRNKVYKPSQKTEKEIPVGLSKSYLNYEGELNEFGFVLKCTSEYQDCWQDKMEFKKIYN